MAYTFIRQCFDIDNIVELCANFGLINLIKFMKFEIENFVFLISFRRVLHASLYLHPILPLSNSCPASDGSLHVRPVLFPRFPITARADARAHVYARVSGRIERRVTRFKSLVVLRGMEEKRRMWTAQ